MVGTTLGSYRLLRILGRGGMGVVYEAEHQLLGRRAAVKLLLPELTRNEELVGRFFNEARATSSIQHPGIVDVLDFGHAQDGSAYIVMEFLEGESLATRMRRERRLTVELIITLARNIAAALGAAHRKGVVHRDLKPDNVFLVPAADVPGGVRPKVVDFGIAKLVRDQNATSLKTRTGSVLGTPLYMSPEQCRGAGAAIDHRSDIYSLGCMMFEMACGQPPFQAEGLGDLFVAHLRDAPPAPATLRPDLPPQLEALILAMLAKQPSARPQSMDEIVAELDTPGSVLATTLRGSSGQVVERPHKRGRATVAVGLFVAAGIGVAALRVTRGGSGGGADTAEPPAAAPVAAVAPPPPPPPPSPAPVVAPQVHVTIESSPPGAEVSKDGAVVGTTPYTRTVPRASGRLTFALRKGGYLDAEVSVSTEADAVATASLAPAPVPAPPPAAAPAAAPPPARARTRSAPREVRLKDETVDPFAR